MRQTEFPVKPGIFPRGAFSLFVVGACLAGFIFTSAVWGDIVNAGSGSSGSVEVGVTTAPSLLLTNAAQVRALTAADAAKRVPIRLCGVVLEKNNGGAFTIIDETAGLYIVGNAKLVSTLEPGDMVEAEGWSDPGEYAPILNAQKVIKLGTGKIPEPPTADVDDLLRGRLDAQWIKVTGVIRKTEHGVSGLNFEMALKGGVGRIVGCVSGSNRVVTVGSLVQLQGVCYYQFNHCREPLRPYLSVPSGAGVEVKEAAPVDLEVLPIRSIESLIQFSVGPSYTHRVRVRGVVTHSPDGSDFWIRDRTHGLQVVGAENSTVNVGTEVDVFGFMGRGEFGPVMEDAVFRETGATAKVEPIQLSAANEALNHDSDLVECEAVILERWTALDGCRLVLTNNGSHFTALLRQADPTTPSDWLAGSRVRVAGICSVIPGPTDVLTSGMMSPGAFQLLLRSASDLQVLAAPPWWTVERFGWVAAGIMGLLLAVGSATTWWHRRRTAQQIATMEAQAALSNERARIARDLHDEIGANLAHISILSTMAAEPDSEPYVSCQHSLEAANVAQQTIRAFDEILWSINPKNDTVKSLSHYICRYAEETLGPAGLRCQFELDEVIPEVNLPPQSRHSLLLAVKEALHNISKHAGARRVNIKCGMEGERTFSVQITDDGRGFNSEASAGTASRQGQGLENLRRRLADLGGECRIESQPGRGTCISFRLQL